MYKRLILLLFSITLILGCTNSNQENICVKDGIIDLSGYDFETSGIIKLNGYWKFYWNQLLTPDDLNSENNYNFQYFNFPGTWNNNTIEGKQISNIGYATYELKVIVNQKYKNQILGIKQKEQATSSRIYINDKKISETGKVATTKEESIPHTIGKLVFFYSDKDTIQIILNVSNYHHRQGGIWYGLELGTEKQIYTSSRNIKAIEIFTAGILLIMVVYYLGIFILRPKDKTSIIFSMFCLIILARLVTTDERILMDFFPNIPFQVYTKIEYLSFFYGFAIVIHFLNSFFPIEFKKIIVKISYVIASVFAVFTLFTPPILYTYTITPFQFIFVLGIVYVNVSIILSLIRKRKYSALIFSGIMLMILTSANDIFYTYRLINTFYLSQYGFLLMIFLQSYVLSKKFTQAFRDVEDLSENLEFKVNQRTLEIAQKNILLEQKNQLIEIQKEEVELSYKNIKTIGEIGKNITTNLSISDILKSTYQHLNKIMDAPVIAFGILDSSFQKLIFYGIENGNFKVLTGYDALTDKNQLSVWCFNNQQIIFINNLDNEFKNYISEKPTHISDKKSLIYCPVTFKDKKIGIFTIQSYKENIYTDYHKTIINNIAVYAAIALENANSFILLENQKIELEKSNNQIHSSLVYASRIQNAILPTQDIKNHLHFKNFIMYKPKDLVSGDFYWFKNFGRYSVIAAADCTGHGVPGAIMSMLGISVLNEIVNRRNLNMPGQILDEMRNLIKTSLKQTGEKGQSQDGMDIAFCSINMETRIMHFAGANNPLWIFRDSQLIELKADRQPVGIFFSENSFTNHTVELKKGDIIYIFSDGFQSQFGGAEFTKYKSVNFRNFVQKIVSETIETQKQMLENEFEKWKGNNKQTDDVLIIGIKVE